MILKIMIHYSTNRSKGKDNSVWPWFVDKTIMQVYVGPGYDTASYNQNVLGLKAMCYRPFLRLSQSVFKAHSTQLHAGCPDR